jgi:hypothetical protein
MLIHTIFLFAFSFFAHAITVSSTNSSNLFQDPFNSPLFRSFTLNGKSKEVCSVLKPNSSNLYFHSAIAMQHKNSSNSDNDRVSIFVSVGLQLRLAKRTTFSIVIRSKSSNMIFLQATEDFSKKDFDKETPYMKITPTKFRSDTLVVIAFNLLISLPKQVYRLTNTSLQPVFPFGSYSIEAGINSQEKIFGCICFDGEFEVDPIPIPVVFTPLNPRAYSTEQWDTLIADTQLKNNEGRRINTTSNRLVYLTLLPSSSVWFPNASTVNLTLSIYNSSSSTYSTNISATWNITARIVNQNSTTIGFLVPNVSHVSSFRLLYILPDGLHVVNITIDITPSYETVLLSETLLLSLLPVVGDIDNATLISLLLVGLEYVQLDPHYQMNSSSLTVIVGATNLSTWLANHPVTSQNYSLDIANSFAAALIASKYIFNDISATLVITPQTNSKNSSNTTYYNMSSYTSSPPSPSPSPSEGTTTNASRALFLSDLSLSSSPSSNSSHYMCSLSDYLDISLEMAKKVEQLEHIQEWRLFANDAHQQQLHRPDHGLLTQGRILSPYMEALQVWINDVVSYAVIGMTIGGMHQQTKKVAVLDMITEENKCYVECDIEEPLPFSSTIDCSNTIVNWYQINTPVLVQTDIQVFNLHQAGCFASTSPDARFITNTISRSLFNPQFVISFIPEAIYNYFEWNETIHDLVSLSTDTDKVAYTLPKTLVTGWGISSISPYQNNLVDVWCLLIAMNLHGMMNGEYVQEVQVSYRLAPYLPLRTRIANLPITIDYPTCTTYMGKPLTEYI